jgi:hypothetical protein
MRSRRIVALASGVAMILVSLGCTRQLADRSPDDGWRWHCPLVVAGARHVGWPDDRLGWVDRIAWRESGCREDAWSPTRDAGVMQIHHRWIGWGLCRAGIACRVSDLFDLHVNLRAAAYVYAAQGPDAWATN